MWRGFENALKLYLNTMIEEWKERGYNNSMKFEKIDGDIVMPSFVGDYAFHASHRSNLLRKDYDYYRNFEWHLPDYLPYQWGNK
jgi:hypothetical protein